MGRRFFCSLVLALLVVVNQSFAEPRKFGVGVVLGEPSGFTLVHVLGPFSGFETSYAKSLLEDNTYHFQASYLYWFNPLLYSGLGLNLRFDGFANLGPRIPIGITINPFQFPLEVFGEGAGIFEFLPRFKFKLNWGGGIRYYF